MDYIRKYFRLSWCLYWIITFIFCPYLRDLFTSGFSNPINFVKFFFIIIVTNCVLAIFVGKIKTFFKFDLLLRFISFFPRSIKSISNFFKIRFELFLKFLKDSNKSLIFFFDSIKKNINFKNYKWYPLFKKQSYFGFFRSFRSKWFK